MSDFKTAHFGPPVTPAQLQRVVPNPLTATALDQVLQGLVDGRGKAERVIVKTLAVAAGLVLLGWTLGHKP